MKGNNSKRSTGEKFLDLLRRIKLNIVEGSKSNPEIENKLRDILLELPLIQTHFMKHSFSLDLYKELENIFEEHIQAEIVQNYYSDRMKYDIYIRYKNRKEDLKILEIIHRSREFKLLIERMKNEIEDKKDEIIEIIETIEGCDKKQGRCEMTVGNRERVDSNSNRGIISIKEEELGMGGSTGRSIGSNISDFERMITHTDLAIFSPQQIAATFTRLLNEGFVDTALDQLNKISTYDLLWNPQLDNHLHSLVTAFYLYSTPGYMQILRQLLQFLESLFKTAVNNHPSKGTFIYVKLLLLALDWRSTLLEKYSKFANKSDFMDFIQYSHIYLSLIGFLSSNSYTLQLQGEHLEIYTNLLQTYTSDFIDFWDMILTESTNLYSLLLNIFIYISLADSSTDWLPQLLINPKFADVLLLQLMQKNIISKIMQILKSVHLSSLKTEFYTQNI